MTAKKSANATPEVPKNVTQKDNVHNGERGPVQSVVLPVKPPDFGKKVRKDNEPDNDKEEPVAKKKSEDRSSGATNKADKLSNKSK